MALLNAQNELAQAIVALEETVTFGTPAVVDQGLNAAEVTWQADEDITVGNVQTAANVAGVVNSVLITTGAQTNALPTVPVVPPSGSSGAVNFRTGTADGASGSGDINIGSGSVIEPAVESGNISFVNGATPSGTERGHLIRQDSAGGYGGIIGSQGKGSRFLSTLDATVVGVGVETAFTLNIADILTFPADFFKVGTTVRFRLWVEANDPAVGANVVIIRVRLGGLTGVLVGQNLTTYDPGAASEVVILDGAFTIRTLGATGTMVSSCISTSGLPGGTVTVAPYVLQSTAIDTTVSQAITITCQFTDATATTAIIQNFVGDAFI